VTGVKAKTKAKATIFVFEPSWRWRTVPEDPISAMKADEYHLETEIVQF